MSELTDKLEKFIDQERKINWEAEFERGEFCIGENKVRDFFKRIANASPTPSWTPFSPDDKGTWPKNNFWYWVQIPYSMAEAYWFGDHWQINGVKCREVLAYQPLPPPYKEKGK